MGCSSNTKKTLAEVGVDLLDTLLDSATGLLGAVALEDSGLVPLRKGTDPMSLLGEDPDEKAERLEKDLQELTQRKFLSAFSYAYNGDRSRPTDLAPNGRVISVEDFVSVAEGDTNALTQYVDNTILGAGSGLPKWFSDTFTNDLLATMTTLIQKGNEDWQYEMFRQQYTDPSGVQQPISASAIMTYANGTLSEDGSNVTKSIIYYSGIYYNSVGWGLAQRRQALIEESLSGALMLGPAPVGLDWDKVIKYSVLGTSAVVAGALAYWIISLPHPQAHVIATVGPVTLTFVVAFRNPQLSLIAAIKGENPTVWLEDALETAGITKWSRTEEAPTKLIAAELSLMETYAERMDKAKSFNEKKLAGKKLTGQKLTEKRRQL